MLQVDTKLYQTKTDTRNLLITTMLFPSIIEFNLNIKPHHGFKPY